MSVCGIRLSEDGALLLQAVNLQEGEGGFSKRVSIDRRKHFYDSKITCSIPSGKAVCLRPQHERSGRNGRADYPPRWKII